MVSDPSFPSDPTPAIKSGFALAEKHYLDIAMGGKVIDRSGSCAIVALIVEDVCYIANVGDSRAVISM